MYLNRKLWQIFQNLKLRQLSKKINKFKRSIRKFPSVYSVSMGEIENFEKCIGKIRF